MNRLSVTRIGAALAVLGAITYGLLFLWHWLARSPFADTAFAAAFPGFSWGYIGFLTGLGWSIIYSLYIAVVFVAAYNLCCRVIPERRAPATHHSRH